MKVVFVGCLGPGMSRPSGVSNYVNNILSELPKAGVEASLIGAGSVADSSLPYEFIPVSPCNGLTSFGFLMRLLASNPSITLPEEPIINAHRPDDMIPFHVLRKKNPKVITLHGTHFRNVYLKRGRIMGKAYDYLERFSIQRTHQLIFVSKKSIELFLGRYPDRKDNTHYIPPGVNTDLFKRLDYLKSRESLRLREDDFVVLYAGRLDREKRLDILLQVFSTLKERREKSKLLIAGAGGDRPRLEALISSHRTKDVRMLGSVPQSRLPLLMSAADAFCILSAHEGFPSVILEALACGLPVVSTRVGDISEVVRPGVTGSILESSDLEEAAEKILEVGSHREQMASSCVRIAREYSWQKVAESTAEVYREVLSNV
ncbi:MAG: glycosyltransferase family 4 protein [Thermoplasmata archaeon]